MSKSIKEIAEDLSVSKQAVLKKIEKLGLKDRLSKIGNQFIVDEKTEKRIKSEFVPRNNNQQFKTVDETYQEFKSIIDTLKAELESKNKQISDLSERLAESQKLLLQQQQLSLLSEQKILMLEEHSKKPIKKHWWQRAQKDT